MVFDDVVQSSFSKTILGTSSPMIAEFLGFYMQTFFCLLKPLTECWIMYLHVKSYLTSEKSPDFQS